MSNFNDRNVLSSPYGDPSRVKVEAAGSKWINAGDKVVKTECQALVTVPELIREAGLDFTVKRVPLAGMVTLDDGSIQPLEVPFAFGALKVHADGAQDMIPGVTVGKKYHFVQNPAAFAINEAMRQQGFYVPQSAGQLRNGALSWLFGSLATREVTRMDGTVDVIENHLLSVNSFDGSTRVVHGLTPRNMGCDNALFATLSGIKTKFSFSHTVSAEEAIAKANEALPQIIRSIDELNEVFQWLADQKMGVKQFRAFADEFLNGEYGTVPQGTDDESILKRAERQNEENELIELFTKGIGNSGVSLWDGYQGVTEWLDHQGDRKRRAVRTAKHLQNDLSSNIFGTSARAKGRALNMLVRGR